jgi:hypothetical protein
VSLIVCSEGLYIGQGVGDKGGQKVASAGALAVCKGHAGHGGLGGVLEGCCLGDGVLWVGSGEVTAVGNLQRGRRRREGGPGSVFLFSSLSHGSGRGRGGWARPRRRLRAWLQGQDERKH